MEQIKSSGFGAYFVNHTTGIYPCDATGVPFSASAFQVKGDPITDVHEDLAAEQKARSTYDNILRFVDDPDVREPIRFLREREVVHYQRFGEGLRIITDNLDDKNFYAFNPAFDNTSSLKNNNSVSSASNNSGKNSNNSSNRTVGSNTESTSGSSFKSMASLPASDTQNGEKQNTESTVPNQQSGKSADQTQSKSQMKSTSTQPLITWSMK